MFPISKSLNAAKSQILMVVLAMTAFAGNSLLCRAALRTTSIDAGTFTTIRLLSGALALWLIVRLRDSRNPDNGNPIEGNWLSALALFAYAASFSLAYLRLPAASGALILFCAVQVTMISYGLWSGESLRLGQIVGFVLAVAGLVGLLLPGLSAPHLDGAALMVAAGIAWGIYSLRGKKSRNPISATAGNFLRSVPMTLALTLVLSLLLHQRISLDPVGLILAIASGALTSGIGYAIWYTALPGLAATTAATVQLSVPVIAALGGVIFLDESVTLRLVLCSAAILGGIALVIAARRRA